MVESEVVSVAEANDTAVVARPRESLWVALLLALSLFAIGPLLRPGYHWGAQDARHNVYFLLEYDASIRDGVLYPRWGPDFSFDYGYPLFSVYAPLSAAMGEVVHLAGLDLVSSVEVVFALAALASALTMYLWLRLYAAAPAAMLGGLLYLYAPYHIADIYVRASLAETVALAFLPLALWAFGRLLGRAGPADLPAAAVVVGAGGWPRLRSLAGIAWQRSGAVVVAGLSYAALMMSSNVMALLFTPVLGGYILVLALAAGAGVGRVRGLVRRLIPAAVAVTLGLCASAVFLLPVLVEQAYIHQEQWLGGYYAYQNHFVSAFQLFGLDWGLGLSVPGPDDGMSFQLGLAPVALSCLGLLAWRQLARPWRLVTAYFLAVSLALIYLMLPISRPLWDLVGLSRFAQFPWRLLALTSLSLACVAMPALDRWAGRSGVVPLLFALLIILPVYPYLRADIRATDPDEVSVQGMMRVQQSSGEMVASPIWATADIMWSPLADQIVAGIEITTRVDYTAAYSSGRLAVHSLAMGTTYEKVWFQADDDQQHIRFNVFYFPGWTGYILDENTEQVEQIVPAAPYGDLGLISVPVPPGRHILLLRFDDTPSRTAGKWLTLLSLAACAVTGVAKAAVALRRRRQS
ncbi:MAG: hypothetical protein ACYC5O_12230 [Anaerolineae bacterium]